MTGRTFWIGTALLAGITLLPLARRTENTQAAVSPSRQVANRGTEEPRPAAAASRPRASSPAPAPAAESSRPTVERTAPTVVEAARPAKPETMVDQFAPVHDLLERAFDAESHDGAWAMSAQRLAETAMQAMLPPRSAIRSVACRATLCRIESTHAVETDVKKFVNQLADPASRPWNGAFYAGPSAQDAHSGVVTVVTYLAREGATMPAIPDSTADDAVR